MLGKLAEGLDLETLDGRARFIGLANPYVEKITPGVLRDLVQARVRDLGGMAQPLSRANPVRQRSNAQSAKRTLELSQRLAEILLRLPYLWQEVGVEQRQELLQHADLSVLGPLLQMLEQHPQADSEEILVRWQGQSGV